MDRNWELDKKVFSKIKYNNKGTSKSGYYWTPTHITKPINEKFIIFKDLEINVKVEPALLNEQCIVLKREYSSTETIRTNREKKILKNEAMYCSPNLPKFELARKESKTSNKGGKIKTKQKFIYNASRRFKEYKTLKSFIETENTHVNFEKDLQNIISQIFCTLLVLYQFTTCHLNLTTEHIMLTENTDKIKNLYYYISSDVQLSLGNCKYLIYFTNWDYCLEYSIDEDTKNKEKRDGLKLDKEFNKILDEKFKDDDLYLNILKEENNLYLRHNFFSPQYDVKLILGSIYFDLYKINKIDTFTPLGSFIQYHLHEFFDTKKIKGENDRSIETYFQTQGFVKKIIRDEEKINKNKKILVDILNSKYIRSTFFF